MSADRQRSSAPSLAVAAVFVLIAGLLAALWVRPIAVPMGQRIWIVEVTRPEQVRRADEVGFGPERGYGVIDGGADHRTYFLRVGDVAGSISWNDQGYIARYQEARRRAARRRATASSPGSVGGSEAR